MTKKMLPLFVLITLAACLLSYKLGSTPVAHAQSLPPSPGTWTLNTSGGNESGLISVTKPAVSGAQHVASCIAASVINSNTTAKNADVVLLSGSTQLLAWQLWAPAGTQNNLNLCDLNVVGAVDTAMTLEIGDGTDLSVEVNLIGYDAE
ncbi:MAG: hypothetical protein WAO10_04585 [Candidatus Sulfotelmatobacter sp.]